MAGKHGGASDKRSQVLSPILEYLEEQQPTCFVLENVPSVRNKKHRFLAHSLKCDSDHLLN